MTRLLFYMFNSTFIQITFLLHLYLYVSCTECVQMTNCNEKDKNISRFVPFLHQNFLLQFQDEERVEIFQCCILLINILMKNLKPCYSCKYKMEKHILYTAIQELHYCQVTLITLIKYAIQICPFLLNWIIPSYWIVHSRLGHSF